MFMMIRDVVENFELNLVQIMSDHNIASLFRRLCNSTFQIHPRETTFGSSRQSRNRVIVEC